MRRPRARSRCANGKTSDYRFAIAVGRWLGRRFPARFQFKQEDPGRPRPRNQSRPLPKRITPGGRTIARCALGANQESRWRPPSLWPRLPLRPKEVPKLRSPDKRGRDKLAAAEEQSL